MRIASLSLLIVMLSAALSGVSAQSLPEGKPIIPGDVGRVWAYYSPQTPGGERCITFYSLGGDTLIGGQTYRGLVRGGGYSYGGSSVPREATDFYYRQEDDRVYFTRRGMDGEALLFDLGLGDGEVFTDWQGGRWSVEVMDKDESAAFFPACVMTLRPDCLRLTSLDDGRVDVIADGVGSLTWGIMPGEAGQLLYSESSVWCTAVALSSPAIQSVVTVPRYDGAESNSVHDEVLDYAVEDGMLRVRGQVGFHCCGSYYVACAVDGDEVTLLGYDLAPGCDCVKLHSIDVSFSGFDDSRTYRVWWRSPYDEAGYSPVSNIDGVAVSGDYRLLRDGDRCTVVGGRPFEAVLYSLSGEVLWRGEAVAGTIDINLASYAAGVSLLRIMDDAGARVVKLVH